MKNSLKSNSNDLRNALEELSKKKEINIQNLDDFLNGFGNGNFPTPQTDEGMQPYVDVWRNLREVILNSDTLTARGLNTLLRKKEEEQREKLLSDEDWRGEFLGVWKHFLTDDVNPKAVISDVFFQYLANYDEDEPSTMDKRRIKKTWYLISWLFELLEGSGHIEEIEEQEEKERNSEKEAA